MQEMITIMASIGITKSAIQNKFFEGLTGYKIEDQVQTQDEEVLEGEVIDTPVDVPRDAGYEVIDPNPVKTDLQNIKGLGKRVFNRVADTKITTMAYNMAVFGVDSYMKIKGTNKLGNILKGALITYADLNAILFGTGVVVAARTLRFTGKLLGKAFKAIKGTAEKAMHNKAVKDIAATKEKLSKQGHDLEALLDQKIAETDEIATDFSKGSNFVQEFMELRGAEEPSIDAIHKCEDRLGYEFADVSGVRDDNLSRMVNRDTITMLLDKVDFTGTLGRHTKDEDRVFVFIEDLTFDKEGNPILPEGYEDIDLSSLDENDMEALRGAVEKSSIVHGTSDISKLEVIDYLECVDGKLQLKAGVNRDALSDELVTLLGTFEGVTFDKDLYDEIGLSNQTLEYLISCQEELLIRTSISATREMEEIVENRSKTITSEQKGFFKSAVEFGKALTTKLQAKAIVGKRVDAHIMDGIVRNTSANDRLMEIAHERLITDQQQMGDPNRENLLGHENDSAGTPSRDED